MTQSMNHLPAAPDPFTHRTLTCWVAASVTLFLYASICVRLTALWEKNYVSLMSRSSA
jgi:hypothetical protein